MSALDQLLAYDFEADQEFEVSIPAQQRICFSEYQRGLQSVLARSDVDQSEKEQLTVKAKLFFFSK
jgi:hypothetical protein